MSITTRGTGFFTRLPSYLLAGFFIVSFIVSPFSMLAGAQVAQAASNIIANPSVETASGTVPASWATDVWGTTKATFTYPTGGAEDGTRYVKTQITTKGTGDAKWYPSTRITAAAGQSYAFSDWYQASVASTVEVEVLLTTGKYSYLKLGAPVISSTWKQFSATFTAPANTKSITILHYIKAVGTLSVDNYSLTSGSVAVTKPVIASFTATPSTISQGATSTLLWSVSPTSTLSISPSVGDVSGTSVVVAPLATTTYTLTASNSAGTTTASVTINVKLPPPSPPAPKPTISAFSANPASIAQGSSTLLSWNVANASSTSIQGIGTVTGNSLSVSPNATTSYVLVANNPQGSVSATTTVNVSVPVEPPPPPAPKPTINAFSASPSSITEGNSATLSWDIVDASSTSIDQGVGVVSGNSTSVSPVATTTYTITATNPQGSVTAQTAITVTPLPPPPPPPPTNMIQNPSFTATSSQGAGVVPAHWATGAWGAAAGAVFSYPVTGVDDNFAAQVSIASYNASGTGNGAAEWYFDTVPVTGGSFYHFSDSYKSDATNYVIAQWTLSTGANMYESVATLTPTGGVWKTGSFYFNAPANATSLTILHQLQSVGTLTVDDYSLSAGSVPSAEQLGAPIVSLAFDDGLLTQYDNALPILKAANIPASFYIISNLMAAVSTYDFFTDPNESITKTTTASGATWSPIYMDPTEQHLHFSDTYTASGPSTIVASYTLNGGTVNQTIATLPAGTNARANVSFILPKKSGGNTVSPITIAHTSAGGLTASEPSLAEYGDGYMSTSQVQAVYAAGEEIGDHTKTHPDLTSLTQSNATTEIAGAKAALEAAGLGPVTTLAYPLGTYNASIEAIAQSAGLTAARTTDIGYNGKLSDHYALKTGNIDTNTSFATVKAWIDTAVAQHLWLTLTIHNVDSVANLNAIGDAYGTTPEILQQIVSYLATKQQNGELLVKTMRDALPLAQ